MNRKPFVIGEVVVCVLLQTILAVVKAALYDISLSMITVPCPQGAGLLIPAFRVQGVADYHL